MMEDRVIGRSDHRGGLPKSPKLPKIAEIVKLPKLQKSLELTKTAESKNCLIRMHPRGDKLVSADPLIR